ncbi:hypothetical protein PG984_007530 [Apiospora sp. TS-2023a]
MFSGVSLRSILCLAFENQRIRKSNCFIFLPRAPAPELLHIILSSTSLDGLYAVIRASPTLYGVFRQTKAATLLKVCANDLGPAIRDAIIAASERAPAEEMVAAWKTRLLSKEDRWLAGVLTSEPLALRIVQINRTAQYFVDFYARTRFDYFERALTRNEDGFLGWGYHMSTGQPQDTSAWGCLSFTERWNLSQAIVRRQTIVGMYGLSFGSPFTSVRRDLPAINSLQDLFEPWEKEQIAQVDRFFYELCKNLHFCEKSDHSFSGLNNFCHKYYPRLPALRQRMIQATAADPGLIDRMLFHGILSRSSGHVRLAWKTLHANPRSPIIPPPSPARVPSNSPSKSTMEPPWGWVSAVGSNGARWGDELVIKRPGNADSRASRLHFLNKEKIERWKWAGLVFWDECRAKSLHLGLLNYSYDHSVQVQDTAGWLARLCE